MARRMSCEKKWKKSDRNDKEIAASANALGCFLN
jgi:hypothetical protein